MCAADAKWWSCGELVPEQIQLPTSQQLYNTPFEFTDYNPVEIGYVSRKAPQSLPNDITNKRYLRTDALKLSNVHFDLMRGYQDKYIRATNQKSERAINHILSWWLQDEGQHLAATKKEPSPSERPLNFDFVSRRGHLAKVFITPYMKDGWKMAVTLFRGSYFIMQLMDEQDFTEAEDRINYMGHKFEQYMTSAQPGMNPDPSEVLDMNESFYSLVTASLSNHSLLLCAEVDSEDTSVRYKKAPACYVELKTTQSKGTPGKVSSIKKLRWWAQSFLCGIPRILVGFKSDDRTVVECSMFEVSQQGLSQTASKASESRNFWKPAVCMNFLNAFLTFVKKVVTEDNPDVVYHFTWSLYSNVQYEIKRGRAHSFLLPEYVQKVTAHSHSPGPKKQKLDE